MMKKEARRAVLFFAFIVLLLLALFLWQNPFSPPIPEPRYFIPEGAQVLLYPLDAGRVTAGYLNRRYEEKNGFNHFGTDFAPRWAGKADVRASGTGTVLGTEFCDNNLGNIVVVLYSDVYQADRQTAGPLVARYYHMTSICVAEGDRLTAGQIIGEIDSNHKWYNHVHLELDGDIRYPYNTPQVAETSSDLLVRFPASGDSLLDPVSVLALGEGQDIAVHPQSDCCTEKDAPGLQIWDFAPKESAPEG